MLREDKVELRRIPYPYKAMLTICSDLDETPHWHVYSETMRFLNTTEKTSMGPGVGLETGNTIYFDMPSGQFSYWNTNDAGRHMIRALVHSGHIDCLHSYGDQATTRAHAGRALDELDRYGCRLAVWIDHGKAPSNFGADLMQGLGDVPDSPVYHADLTCSFGIKYVWRGRVTSVIGQECAASLAGVWTPRHPVTSARTVAKEAVKHFLGQWGHRKYAMHGKNRVLQPSSLRDGRPIHEFLRSNPHWEGVNSCETARGIGQVLTQDLLSRLIRREGICILYTHLGKVHDGDVPFDASAVAGFRRLAQAYHDKQILVLTTHRALRYLTLRRHLTWTAHREANNLVLHVRLDERDELVRATLSVRELAGMTFYVPDGVRCRIMVNGVELEDLQVNPPDQTNRPSVMIPMRRLFFPNV